MRLSAASMFFTVCILRSEERPAHECGADARTGDSRRCGDIRFAGGGRVKASVQSQRPCAGTSQLSHPLNRLLHGTSCHCGSSRRSIACCRGRDERRCTEGRCSIVACHSSGTSRQQQRRLYVAGQRIACRNDRLSRAHTRPCRSGRRHRSDVLGRGNGGFELLDRAASHEARHRALERRSVGSRYCRCGHQLFKMHRSAVGSRCGRNGRLADIASFARGRSFLGACCAAAERCKSTHGSGATQCGRRGRHFCKRVVHYLLGIRQRRSLG